MNNRTFQAAEPEKLTRHFYKKKKTIYVPFWELVHTFKHFFFNLLFKFVIKLDYEIALNQIKKVPKYKLEF